VTRGSAPRSSTSWAKGRRAITIVAAAVGANADADADAGAIVLVVPPAIPPPVVVVRHGSAPRSFTSWLKGQRAIAIIAAAVRADTDADANADAGVVLVIVPPAIPPPIAEVKGVDRLHRAMTVPLAGDCLILTGIMKNGHE
jgi:hypothetical protein